MSSPELPGVEFIPPLLPIDQSTADAFRSSLEGPPTEKDWAYAVWLPKEGLPGVVQHQEQHYSPMQEAFLGGKGIGSNIMAIIQLRERNPQMGVLLDALELSASMDTRDGYTYIKGVFPGIKRWNENISRINRLLEPGYQIPRFRAAPGGEYTPEAFFDALDNDGEVLLATGSGSTDEDVQENAQSAAHDMFAHALAWVTCATPQIMYEIRASRGKVPIAKRMRDVDVLMSYVGLGGMLREPTSAGAVQRLYQTECPTWLLESKLNWYENLHTTAYRLLERHQAILRACAQLV